ncbi:MAG: acetate uptake transporter [Geobacteraceae bacterium]|nr:acetate uptake transporter [Geobacteraceae bacterium]
MSNDSGQQGGNLNEFISETRERFAKAGTVEVSDLDGDHAVFADMGENVTRNEVAICDTTANPAPLGLCAFGLTTVLLNLHNAGFFPLDAMILAMGIFYGGIAQVIVGIMEWKKKNTFATTAFTSYGLFWLTLVGLIVMPKLGLAEKPTEIAMAAYLGIWGLFTLILFIGTFRLNRALQVVFGLLALLFFLLAYKDATGAPIGTFIGYEGILTGLSAIYTGLAQVLNEVYGKTLLPLGPYKK